MDYEKKGICDDCNNANNLILVSACAESEVGYGPCCEKYICKNGCKWYCSLCFKNTSEDDILYVCLLEHKFKKLFKNKLFEWKQNIYNILPFNNSIKRIIIELLKPELNYREDYFPQYNIPFKCPNLKPIETPICKKCIKLYINNPITNKPILWFGISSNEWLHRYG